jgi:hypothetical protein
MTNADSRKAGQEAQGVELAGARTGVSIALSGGWLERANAERIVLMAGAGVSVATQPQIQSERGKYHSKPDSQETWVTAYSLFSEAALTTTTTMYSCFVKTVELNAGFDFLGPATTPYPPCRPMRYFIFRKLRSSTWSPTYMTSAG